MIDTSRSPYTVMASVRGMGVAVMTKTSVDVDRDIASQAAAVLGTVTLRDTINASLREVVDAKRRLELIALLSERERFDFDAAEVAWGAAD